MTMRWLGSTGGALLALLATMASACFSAQAEEPAPGNLTQELRGNWVQGEESEVLLAWHDANDCGFGDLGCEPRESTTTLLDAECTGCQILPRTSSATVQSGEMHLVRAMPATDGAIELRITLRFDATGDVTVVTATQRGDHEVALEGQCRLIDTAALHDKTKGQEREVPASLFRPCDEPRLATDSVVVFPMIRTFHDRQLFPFLRASGGERRTRDQLTFSTSPVLWARSEALPTGAFAELPSGVSAATLTITAPLADGTTATATVAIPAVAAR